MRTYFFILLTFICSFAFAQEKNLIPKEKWSKKFYLSDEFMATKGLKPGETNGLLRAWNAAKKENKFFRVVDLRWYFNTADEAKQHLRLNLPYLSESGDVIKEIVKIDRVTNLYVFNEGAGNRSMNKAMGIESYSYIFLFTVKNYIAKVYVNSGKPMSVNDAAAFAREASNRLNAVVK